MPFDPPERPAGSYEPHPAGTYIGTITEIKDYGKMDSLYRTADGNTKEVHRVAIVVTAEQLQMESGDPWSHYEFVNISFAPKSRLTELRNLLRDVDLTNAELNEVFDETVEMIGRKVRYKIRHKKNEDNDKIRAVIHDWEYADGEASAPAETMQKDAAKEAVKKAFDGGDDDDLPSSAASGMSKREHFAACAITGLATDGPQGMPYLVWIEKSTERAVDIADALIEALNATDTTDQ